MTHTALALKSHNRNPVSTEELVERGEALFTSGDLDSAERLFTEALATDPKSARALNNLGVLAHRRGQREAAIALFTRALVAEPTNIEASENVVSLLAEISQKQLCTIGRYAFPYLLIRLVSSNWWEADKDFLRQSSGCLEDTHLRVLFDLVRSRADSIGTDSVVLAVSAMRRLDPDQLESLGQWMERANISRRERDALELQICLKGTDDQLVRRVSHRAGIFHADQFSTGWERYPRRVTEPAQPDDPFMKLVPADAPSKVGGMRVLIISDFNIAGQGTALMRALNRYTNHMARCVIFQDDYLSYDRDILIHGQDGIASQAAIEEALSLIPKSDFFHFGRGLFNFPGIDWNRYISPQNCVFQYYGSELRDNGPQVAAFHASTGFPAITAVDHTMYRLLPASYYHIQPYMLEMDRLPQAEWENGETMRLCHAPSGSNYRKIKRTDLILETMTRLTQGRPDLDSVLIENMSNAECLQAKSRCHVHIVSLIPGFGLNTIESAAMGLVPITGVDNFSRLLYPDSPVVGANESNLQAVLEGLVSDRSRAREIGAACREWAYREFNAPSLVKKYWYLYDLIYHGHSLEYPEIFR